MPASRRPIHLLQAAACALALAALPVQADRERDREHDQDRARAAVQAGQALPLKTVLVRLEREAPGQVLDVELEQKGDRWIYEIKLLQPGGLLVKLEVDAATAEVLRRKERPRGPDARP